MVLKKEQKETQIEELRDTLADAKGAVFVNYQGLKVKEINELRDKLRAEGVKMRVTKNTLLRLALKKLGIEVEQEVLDVPLALATSKKDEVVASKVIAQFSKEHEILQAMGGIVDNKFLNKNEVDRLALTPSRDELYAKLVGSLNSPLFGTVNVLAGNLRGLVSVLNQYKEKKV